MKKVFVTISAIFLVAISFAQVNLQQGLVAYYPLNGTSNDSSSNSNDGVIKGATPAGNRFNLPNQAFFFDGDDQAIEIPSSSSLIPTNAVSVAAWVYTTDKEYWNYAVTKRYQINAAPYNSYVLGTTGFTNSKWLWGISSNTKETDLVANTLVEENKWIQLTGTYSGDTMKLFMNGKEIARQSLSTPIAYSNLPLRLGIAIATNSGPKSAWKGYLDEIRIYNRELTEDEVKYLYDPSLLGTERITPETIGLKLYPNPSSNKVFINTFNSKDKLDNSKITITDISGREIIQTKYSAEGIDVSPLTSGVYFVNISVFNSTIRFIKK